MKAVCHGHCLTDQPQVLCQKQLLKKQMAHEVS